MCELKTGVWENRNAGSAVVYTALRQTASKGAGSSGVLTNGDFSNGLSAWSPGPANGNCASFPWTVANVMAGISLGSCGNTFFSVLKSSYTIPAGSFWTLSVDMVAKVQGAGTGREDCLATFAGVGVPDYYVNLPALGSGKRTYTANGVLSAVYQAEPFAFGIYCGRGGQPVRISFDNIRLSVVSPEAGSNPTVLAPVQVIKNGNFGGSDLSPWSSAPSPPQAVSLVDGAGVIAMAPFSTNFAYSYFGQSMTLYQNFGTTYDAGQTYRFTAKMAISYPGDVSAYCSASFYAGSDRLGGSDGTRVAASSTVDVSGVLKSSASGLSVQFSCNGAGAAAPKATVDDIQLTFNV